MVTLKSQAWQNKNITNLLARTYTKQVDIPVLYVKWFDSTSEDDWEGISEKLDPHDIETIGWFIAETDEYITLALNIDGHAEDEPLVSQKISIPKVNIRETKKYKFKS